MERTANEFDRVNKIFTLDAEVLPQPIHMIGVVTFLRRAAVSRFAQYIERCATDGKHRVVPYISHQLVARVAHPHHRRVAPTHSSRPILRVGRTVLVNNLGVVRHKRSAIVRTCRARIGCPLVVTVQVIRLTQQGCLVVHHRRFVGDDIHLVVTAAEAVDSLVVIHVRGDRYLCDIFAVSLPTDGGVSYAQVRYNVTAGLSVPDGYTLRTHRFGFVGAAETVHRVVGHIAIDIHTCGIGHVVQESEDILPCRLGVLLGVPKRGVRRVGKNNRRIGHIVRAECQIAFVRSLGAIGATLLNPQTLDRTLVVLVRQHSACRTIQVAHYPQCRIAGLVVGVNGIGAGLGCRRVNTQIITLAVVHGRERCIGSRRNGHVSINDVTAADTAIAICNSIKRQTKHR